jgi:hypothetical protein
MPFTQQTAPLVVLFILCIMSPRCLKEMLLSVTLFEAVDRVDHMVLLINWADLNCCIAYLNGLFLSLLTEVALLDVLGLNLAPLASNLIIIHGSGLGSIFYLILESDLKAKSETNVIFNNNTDDASL